jgi:hypothetical protein
MYVFAFMLFLDSIKVFENWEEEEEENPRWGSNPQSPD